MRRIQSQIWNMNIRKSNSLVTSSIEIEIWGRSRAIDTYFWIKTLGGSSKSLDKIHTLIFIFFGWAPLWKKNLVILMTKSGYTDDRIWEIWLQDLAIVKTGSEKYDIIWSSYWKDLYNSVAGSDHYDDRIWEIWWRNGHYIGRIWSLWW